MKKLIALTTLAASVAFVEAAAPSTCSAGESAKSPVAATATAPSRTGASITYKRGGETVDAYLATPKEAGPHPAVIVIQEWWGLNDQIRSVADQLAAKGYVALAPDLYRGKVATDPQVAMELLRSLPQGRAGGDLAAAFSYLRSLPSVGSKPIGSIGFCMGGELSLRLALGEAKLAACVICYGRLESDPEKLKAIGAPALGIFGGTDHGITQEMIDGFKKGMQTAGKSLEVKVYPEAGHGFMNPSNPGHRPDDTKDAWSLIDAFLAKHLRS